MPMEQLRHDEWAHASGARYPRGQRLGIAVYDDEFPGEDSVYVIYADGVIPARTIEKATPGHWESCMAAWCGDRCLIVEDHRRDTSRPLPVAGFAQLVYGSCGMKPEDIIAMATELANKVARRTSASDRQPRPYL